MISEIVEAACEAPFHEALHLATRRIWEALDCDRASVILVDPERGPIVAATRERAGAFDLPLSLERYPEVQRALESLEPVIVCDAPADPLMEPARALIAPLDVRSILVHPLVSDGEALGALFVRRRGRAGAYGPAELELARTVAVVLAGRARRERAGAALERRRDELELAYVDRYTELLNANRRLQGLNKFKDETIAVCSHDLRGPLNVLLGHARLLADGDLSGQDEASVQAIIRQVKKLLDLVETLLDRSRGADGALGLEPAQLDLAAVCRELAGEHEILGAERGVSIQVEAPAALPAIGDRVKLRQVLQNLLGNAVSHAREGGDVRLVLEKLERPGGCQARIAVSDDGEGIAPDQMPYIFERYWHGKGGTGLGLAICKELVELHGGEVWAESEPGHGSTFFLTLPVTEAQLPGERLNSASERRRVLLVEDDAQIAAVTAEILRARWRVDIAQDGAAALAKARGFRPDVIVMDVFLPHVDGLDATAALKAGPDTRDIPVILVSAHQGVADKVRALNLGAFGYLAKPFEIPKLLACVESALESRSADSPGSGRAGIDPRTGVLDARGFVDRLAQEIARAHRYGRKLALLALSPRARLPAESLGAAAGGLAGTLRAGDSLGHLGDGLFAACLSDVSCEEGARVAERLAAVVRRAAGIEVSPKLTDACRGPGAAALLEELLGRKVV